MEQAYKKVESVGVSDTGPNEGGQDTRVTASEWLQPIDWFEMAQRMILSQLLSNQRGI